MTLDPRIIIFFQASTDMEEIFTFIDNLGKRLARNITDLDDVRSSMAGLSEIRESEIK
jgi:dynein heavy chain